ncbi:MAG TPA: hypothetical protein VFM98_10625, partial [Ramlibacter sp.]|nr:hypothetical protein [Ramlibacter sp.]
MRHLTVTVVGFVLCAALTTRAFGTLSPVWYASGIAVVALLLHPPRQWAWFLLPIYVGDAAVFRFFDHGPPLLLAGADMVEIVFAAALIRASGGIR